MQLFQDETKLMAIVNATKEEDVKELVYDNLGMNTQGGDLL
ncbi:hypothetical protein [Bacillus sp. JCM 19041]